MKIAILGLAQTGKKTLFNLLTGRPVPANRKAGEAVEGIATIRDSRVDALSKLFKPKKTTYAENLFVLCPDVADGSTSRLWMDPARRCDLLFLLIRAFDSPEVFHPLGSVDPARDRAMIESELLLADMQLVETRLQRLAKEKKGGQSANQALEEEILNRFNAALEEEKFLSTVALGPDDLLLDPVGAPLGLPAHAHHAHAVRVFVLDREVVEDVAVLRRHAHLPSAHADDVLRQVADRPVDDVEVVHVLLDDVVAGKPRKVIPVADLVMHFGLARQPLDGTLPGDGYRLMVEILAERGQKIAEAGATDAGQVRRRLGRARQPELELDRGEDALQQGVARRLLDRGLVQVLELHELVDVFHVGEGADDRGVAAASASEDRDLHPRPYLPV